ncbi:hypothetical protein GGU11DRAFT_646309, partial [Lentinula aff. detonsa]
IGDPLAERLEYILTQHAPFPGESVNSIEIRSLDRFVAYRISNQTHLLIDSAGEGKEHQIPTHFLVNPDFEPCSWFARQSGDSSAGRHNPSQPMGDARATRVSQILNVAVNYPGDDLPEFHPRRS